MSDTQIDTARFLETVAGKWIVAPSEKGLTPKLQHRVIIGTGGSYDYLKDSTNDKRFWRLTQISVPLDLRHTASDTAAEEDPPCDGIHNTRESRHALCTRCFPYGQNLQDVDDREDAEVCPDNNQEHQEME
jgi:hypothetical protein